MENEAFEKFVDQDFNDLAKWMYSLNAYEFIFIATLVGTLIAGNLTINQQNSLGNFFEQIGQTLLTIGTQNTLIKHNNRRNAGIKRSPGDSNEDDIKAIKEEIIQLRRDALNNNNI